jgi:hypothetical protein
VWNRWLSTDSSSPPAHQKNWYIIEYIWSDQWKGHANKSVLEGHTCVDCQKRWGEETAERISRWRFRLYLHPTIDSYSGLVAIVVESLDGKIKVKLGARILDHICKGLKAQNWKNTRKVDSLKRNWFPQCWWKCGDRYSHRIGSPRTHIVIGGSILKKGRTCS